MTYKDCDNNVRNNYYLKKKNVLSDIYYLLFKHSYLCTHTDIAVSINIYGIFFNR